MPALQTLPTELNVSCQSGFPALLLMLILITSCPSTLVEASEAAESFESAAHSGLVTGSSVDAVILAVSPATMPRSSPADDALAPRAGKVLKEIGKQAIDQPGHFLIGAAPIWASRYLVGVPWYGWVAAPLLAYREWLQWPSNRWWDPPLDWAFLSLGAIVATCRRRSPHRWLDGAPALRRRIARELSSTLARWSDTTSNFARARAALTPGTARRRRSLSAAAKAGSPR
jgi:hypothetical protein